MKKAMRTGSLQRELEQLEAADPNVGAAAKKYDETVRAILRGKDGHARLTLEEAQEVARVALAGKSRSYVKDATDLAEFVLGLQSVRPRLQKTEDENGSDDLADRGGRDGSGFRADDGADAVSEEHSEADDDLQDRGRPA